MDFCLLIKIWVQILVKVQVKTWMVSLAKESATDALKTSNWKNSRSNWWIGSKMGSKIANIIKKFSKNSQ